jgi:hypothetical protein
VYILTGLISVEDVASPKFQLAAVGAGVELFKTLNGVFTQMLSGTFIPVLMFWKFSKLLRRRVSEQPILLVVVNVTE